MQNSFVERQSFLSRVGRTRQFPGKDLGLYVQRFHERALDYCDAVDDETILYVCLHGIAYKYRVLLENLTFSYFSNLMEIAREQMNLSEGHPDQVLLIVPVR